MNIDVCAYTSLCISSSNSSPFYSQKMLKKLEKKWQETVALILENNSPCRFQGLEPGISSP